jgi:hypothetical protein
MAQINPAFVVRSGLSYNKIEYKGDGLFGFETSDKFGYMDKNGNIVIAPDYSYKENSNAIPVFNKGLVAIKKGDKMGVIDKSGKIIIPFEYDYAYTHWQVKDAFPVIKKESGKNLYGLINAQNKIVIPIVYEEMLMDSNLVKLKKDNKWWVMNISGKQILPDAYDAITTYSQGQLIQATKGDQLKFFDASGTFLFEKAKNVYTILGCTEGMIRCKVNDKQGYLDLKGNEVIITRYDDANDFVNGLAKVGKKTTTSGTTVLYGFIDKKANEILPIKYPSANLGLFQFGLIKAKDPETNRWGYYDKTGKCILQPAYLEATNSDYLGGLWVKMTDGKYHYISKAGKDFGTADSKGANYYFFGDSGYSVYEDAESSYALVDKTGKQIKKLEDCDAIYWFFDGVAGYRCKSNSKYGFIDINGNTISPCEYDGFSAFTEGISKVEKKVDGKTKYGYLDNKGEVILPAVYESAQSFRNGWGLIKKDQNYFFTDRKGNLQEPPRKYDELSEFRSGYAMGKIKGSGTEGNTYYYINTQLKEEFSINAQQAFPIWENVAVVSRDNKTYELMDNKGHIFRSLAGIDQLSFCADSRLAVKQGGKWGYINDKGDVIVAPKYDTCESFRKGYGRIRMNGKWGIIDKSGTEIFAPKYDNILQGENGIFIYYDKNWGVMDKAGKILVAPTYYLMIPFDKDRSLARLGKDYSILKSPLIK